MIQSRYSMAIIVRHPFRDPSELVETIGLVPAFTHTAGMPRTTPDGRPVAGRHRESYACFYVRIASDVGSAVKSVSDLLGHKAAAVREWIDEGGRVACAVSASGAYDPLLLTADVLGACARHRITLELATHAVPQELGAVPLNDVGGA